ncbi:LysM peptidoglycan-binding domain-containing protein [Micromonospora sp. NPDC049559]|uniref:LysM peptidoglycan-binding domain-containing protein n=1 Tax=Micromonospora sp. NPDC049559 TaxID=3155923 RepID=UPI00342A6BA4
MPTPGRSATSRAGRIGTGIGALVVLLALLLGAPAALVALAGNPLPDHVPGLNEITTVLTSRDDGQLFLRALAVVGWLGWATFALSVLVEIPARVLRRPAVRLPGLGRQQRAAAALVGSVALIIAASPAAATASAALPAVATAAQPAPSAEGPVIVSVPPPGPQAAPATGPALPEPVYRVERDDYLGEIADRYLGDFDRYPELARLNKIHNPDRIREGQLLHLPDHAVDRGVRDHATGLVAAPPPPGGWPEVPSPHQQPGDAEPAGAGAPPRVGAGPGGPERGGPAQPGGGTQAGGPAGGAEWGVPAQVGTGGSEEQSRDGVSTFTFGASRAAEPEELNRPLAVTAVLAAASMVGAQVGALLGLRRRPAPGRIASGRHRLRDRVR